MHIHPFERVGKRFRFHFFVYLLVVYFKTFLRSKWYYKSNVIIIILCFNWFYQITYTSFSLQSPESESGFDTPIPKEHGKQNGKYTNTDAFAQVYIVLGLIFCLSIGGLFYYFYNQIYIPLFLIFLIESHITLVHYNRLN